QNSLVCRPALDAQSKIFFLIGARVSTRCGFVYPGYFTERKLVPVWSYGIYQPDRSRRLNGAKFGQIEFAQNAEGHRRKRQVVIVRLDYRFEAGQRDTAEANGRLDRAQ